MEQALAVSEETAIPGAGFSIASEPAGWGETDYYIVRESGGTKQRIGDKSIGGHVVRDEFSAGRLLQSAILSNLREAGYSLDWSQSSGCSATIPRIVDEMSRTTIYLSASFGDLRKPADIERITSSEEFRSVVMARPARLEANRLREAEVLRRAIETAKVPACGFKLEDLPSAAQQAAGAESFVEFLWPKDTSPAVVVTDCDAVGASAIAVEALRRGKGVLCANVIHDLLGGQASALTSGDVVTIIIDADAVEAVSGAWEGRATVLDYARLLVRREISHALRAVLGERMEAGRKTLVCLAGDNSAADMLVGSELLGRCRVASL